MEQKMTLNADIRGQKGSTSARRLRKQGLIPAIIYGHKKDAIAITVSAHDFDEAIHHGHRLMDLKVGKKKETIIIKDLQYDHLGRDIIHVDLMRVDVAETIKVTVPIELKGVARGTHEGGVIEVHTDHLEVECKVTDIPKSIVVNVKEIGLGDTLHASDIELPSEVKLVSAPSTLLVTCSLVAVTKSTEELEAEMPVAPEVIGEVKEEAEEAEEKPSEETK
ncbi:MAG: 50S ribosomal protein L25 [Sedimentisphaerales bacterium]|nr:50S ribosomal protein L25 [Sedimentisphaerales bacterium]